MASGGGATPGGAAMWESQFTTEQLQILVDEAHRLGLPVAAHAHGTDSIRSAVTARVDTLEHCTWMGQGKAFTPRADITDVVDQIATARIPVCPAHACNWDLFARMRGPTDATELLSRLRWLADRGITLIAGTDAGLAAFTDLGIPRLTAWGFTPEEVLDMATVHSAAALGLATTTGALRPGYSADILAVRGNPLSDLDALTRVEMVMTRGRAHHPAQV
jgi:imidazolonepropionase-like amidohydrolase